MQDTSESCSSSQDSAITVHSDPPAQPYRLAFWDLIRRTGCHCERASLVHRDVHKTESHQEHSSRDPRRGQGI